MIEMARIVYLHHAADVPLHSLMIGRQSVLMLSRIVTPPIHADHIVAAVDNVLEPAREMLGGVRFRRAKLVRANDTRLSRTRSRLGRTMANRERAALVPQRRWVSVLNVSGTLLEHIFLLHEYRQSHGQSQTRM